MESHQSCKTTTLSPGSPGTSKVESEQICCRVLSDNSSEISETFTKKGKEEENYKQTERNTSGSLGSSGQCKTLSHASGRNIVSKKQTSLKNETKLLNVTDSVALENKWFKKWINCLKAKENPTAQNQQSPKPPKEVEEITEEELDSLCFFCTTRIDLMSKQKKKSRTKKLQYKSGVENPVSDKSNLVVTVWQVNRLNPQDPKAQVRKMALIKEYNSAHSSDHNKKRELKQVAFQTEKKTFLESTRPEEKMEEYKYIKDILILIGEIHKNLPRLSDNPEKIWKRLNIRGYNR
ncbi:uncharacterized protein C8orf48-like [Phascolarctos cinereus]|uniref:Uncharacterized protein C8orf48-like n=1 Tax=Phascolarctos cinereus TaxID=38626 RepID=A0A6P5IXB1_PHACI|nr:uncharacterized protein C8orf48-like [Phascolarctos cinereus]